MSVLFTLESPLLRLTRTGFLTPVTPTLVSLNPESFFLLWTSHL
jgi:hypothetical protein